MLSHMSSQSLRSLFSLSIVTQKACEERLLYVVALLSSHVVLIGIIERNVQTPTSSLAGQRRLNIPLFLFEVTPLGVTMLPAHGL